MTSSRLIIHIGLHKTASTYLQYQLFPCLQEVRYIHGNRFFEMWQEQVGSGHSNFLWSYEGFSGVAWNANLLAGRRDSFHWMKSFNDNIESLRQFFPDATIVVFFRKHGDLLLSMYRQYVQEGGVLSLGDFYGEHKVISPADLSFKDRMEIIASHFSKSYFLNYERYRDEGDPYVKAFFRNAFGLEFADPLLSKNVKSNNSITGKKVEYLRRINFFYQRWPRKLRSALRYVGWSPRDLFQDRLAFWRPADPPEFGQLKAQVNQEMSDDWSYFLMKQWEGEQS